MKKLNYTKILPVQLAELLDVSESAISQGIKKRRLALSPDGTLDLRHITNRGYVERRTLRRNEPDMAKRARAEALLKRLDKLPPLTDEDGLPIVRSVVEITGDLLNRAKAAELAAIVDKARIVAARATREELELSVYKHELAPMSLMAYWYSFAEAMITRQYARFGEIFPQLEALVKGGDSKSALQLLRREQEAIIKKAVQDLQNDIQREGYNRVD
jgi:hypothetical protein